MDCPRDGSQLIAQRYEGNVVVDHCPSCRGIWLDRGELERVQEKIERDYASELSSIDAVAGAYEMARQQSRPAVDCPKCGRALGAGEYAYCSQIVIDRCAECGGIWFDAGELQALERFFERHAGVQAGFWASLLDRLR